MGINKKVLIMDDEDFIQTVCKNICDALGYVADVASDGEEMIEKFKKSLESGDSYHYVVMDLTIPGHKGGKEFIQELLRLDSDVIAIVTSGDSTDPVMENYKDYGFSAALAKPFDLEKVQEVIGAI